MYDFLAHLAQTFGLILFVCAFILVLIYALAPVNKDKFDRASQLPLEEDSQNDSI